MVHALERIHRWLEPQRGVLVDIHPLPIARPLEVRGDGQTWLAGELVNESRFETYRAADHALADAVQRGLYAPVESHEFAFDVAVDTLDDLYDYLGEGDLIGAEMDVTELDAAVARRVEVLLATPGQGHEIVLQRPVRMASFRRC